MLLTEYNRINEIDESISQLQAKLTELYFERSNIIYSGGPTKHFPAELDVLKAAAPEKPSWESETYENLLSTWQTAEISIPAFEKIENKLRKARSIMDDLALSQPDSSFLVMLVPPAKTFEKMVTSGIFSSQNIHFNDSMAAFKSGSKARSWKVYIVAAKTLIGSIQKTEEIAPVQLELMPGYEMPGLNAREYAIFALNHKDFVPENSWTILSRDTDEASGQVACAVRIGDSFQFELDRSDVLVGENHFRPAMEITEKG